jgi:hypothetical protein
MLSMRTYRRSGFGEAGNYGNLVIIANADEYHAGKTGLLGFFVG